MRRKITVMEINFHLNLNSKNETHPFQPDGFSGLDMPLSAMDRSQVEKSNIG